MITFDCKGGTWTCGDSYVKVLKQTFPRKDVDAELLKAKLWCMNRPSRRKMQKNMPKFLANWMDNAPDKPRGFIETHTDSSWASDL